ncbi:MAG: ABC-F family ATP-binding cassette domain-containing protein [Prevotellaceae bacterium]|jgi:ATP-binding cassette subfamily F protein 3|nr:ABC-F family ATP-binding cassette domain-containing protein [Prevotellaceae bacterium]
MVSINNLTVEFGGFTLFDEVSFAIGHNDRIGLVGKNGAGKSTLLKILMGKQSPTSGQVVIPSSYTTGYLPQEMKLSDSKSVLDETLTAFAHLHKLQAQIENITHQLAERTDYESNVYHKLIIRLNDLNDHYHLLGGDNQEGEAERNLLGLGFKREDFNRPSSEFSGGWRMRIELAKILLQRPQLLLLDEPTNHLDIESIQWLEDYLKEYYGAVLLISHDRALLDSVTNRTVELLLGKAYDYKVPYSHYVELRRERREQQVATYENQQRMIEKTEEFIERFRYKASKAVQVQSRIKHLEKIDRITIDDEDTSALYIKFPPAPRSGQVAFSAKEVKKQYGNHIVFQGANIVIERGEKVAFVGRNGEGKTTMLRIAVNDLGYEAGEVKLGYNVEVGYFAQNQDEIMDTKATVFETLDRVAVGNIRAKLRDILGAFLFRGEDVDKKVQVLSGGERSRLAMAKLMLQPYNLLALDEPTNHMDMRSKDILKRSLMKYDGTLLVVSHDREFLDGLVNKIYEFRDGKVKEHLGSINDFLHRRKLENFKEIERKEMVVVEKSPDTSKNSEEERRLRKEQERKARKRKNEIEAVEKAIAESEQKIAAMDTILANPEGQTINDDFFKQYNKEKANLERRMYEWEMLINE